MTEAELDSLSPYFSRGERYLNGKPIDWENLNYQTMFWMKRLREALGVPLILIRGPHPNRQDAVDACCPSAPLSHVYLALTRLPQCSWGVYSGNSFHIDTRSYQARPARWMAVKESEASRLSEAGFDENLVTSRKDGWLYLAYDHKDAFAALTLVCRLAEV